MNRERVEMLAQIYEQAKIINTVEVITLPNGSTFGFNMDLWLSRGNPSYVHCGTVGCIGGTVETIWNVQPDNDGDYIVAAGEALGLTPREAVDLFHPNRSAFYVSYIDVTAEDAAKVLRHLFDTGEVDWTVAGYTRRGMSFRFY